MSGNVLFTKITCGYVEVTVEDAARLGLLASSPAAQAGFFQAVVFVRFVFGGVDVETHIVRDSLAAQIQG